MATRLTLSVAGDEPGVSKVVDVDESFDRCLDLVIPLEQPSSALQARERVTLTQAGSRIFVRPEVVAVIEEDHLDA